MQKKTLSQVLELEASDAAGSAHDVQEALGRPIRTNGMKIPHRIMCCHCGSTGHLRRDCLYVLDKEDNWHWIRNDRRWRNNWELARGGEQISRSTPRLTRRNKQPLENERELAEMGERHYLHSPHPTFNMRGPTVACSPKAGLEINHIS